MTEDLDFSSEIAAIEKSEEELEDLTLPDIEIYEAEGPGSGYRIKNINYRHQRMATLLALGNSQTQVAHAIGCTISTVCRLANDPTFKMLVQQKLEELQEQDHSIQMKMTELAESGLDKLHQMLANVESPKTALSITTEMLDRVGHGPSKSVDNTINLGVSAAVIEGIKSDARASRPYKSPIKEAPSVEIEEANIVSEMGRVGGEPISETEEPNGGESEGTSLPAQVLPLFVEEL